MAMKRPIGRIALPTLVALSLAACPTKSAIWIEPGSTATHLVFGVGETPKGPPLTELPVVAVFPCGMSSDDPAHAVWVITHDSAGPVPAHVTYAERPAGYVTRKGPTPLERGCYRAAIAGTGTVTFQVDSAGKVGEM
jgi:hypothetical protein